jgi:hypothetical protein
MYGIFGANPLPYHAAVLIMLAANALLVMGIMRVMTGDRVISCAAGFVYASASAVHLECLLWAVGVNDLGGAFFFLASILLFLKGRSILSATAFFIGCLFKEAVITLPIILAGFAVAEAIGLGRAERGRLLRRLGPLAVAWLAIITIRLFMVSPLKLPAGHAYAMAFSSKDVVRNLASYMSWMVQSFDPFLASSGITVNLLISEWAIVLVGIALFSRAGGGGKGVRRGTAGAKGAKEFDRNHARPGRAPRVQSRMRTLLVLAFWMVIALAPVIFLSSKRSFRYYAIYSLPAFVGTTFLQLCIIGDFARLKRRYLKAALVFITAAAVTLSLFQTRRILGEGLAQRTETDGTNWLIRKAATVTLLHDGLMRLLPNPPNDSNIFIAGANLGAIGMSSAVRVWYDDKSLTVYPLIERTDPVTLQRSWVPVKNPVQGQKIQGAEAFEWKPGKYFTFQLRGNALLPLVLVFDQTSTPLP